jgi:Predicted transcriptional regulators
MTGAKRRASARNGAGANGDVLQDADRQEPEEVRHASLSEERAEPGRVFEMELWEIAPSPLNEKLYRPIDDPDDPEIIALKESIAEHGVKEPLIITTDDVILSGHRRYVAAKLAGRESVPCIRVAIDSDDPEFLRLLGECNRQRIKTHDEIFRETVVAKADPDEEYESLIAHRRKKSATKVETIKIIGKKTRKKISAAKIPFLNAIKRVMAALKAFWPLTDRTIHYELLGDPPLKHASKPDSVYTNEKKSYNSLTELLTRARLVGIIPMDSIDDATRPIVTWDAHASTAPFIRRSIGDFLKGYWRDLQQSQANLIEIVGEKNTLAGFIRPIAEKYCITFTTGRGYCSLAPRRDMAARFKKSGKEKLIVLFLSDFDPDGQEIAHSFARSMRDDFDIPVEGVQVMLTAAQVRKYKLLPEMKASDKESRHRDKFIAKHGDDVFEVEALPIKIRQKLLTAAIDSVIDRKAFNAELDAEKADAAFLADLRTRAHGALEALANISDER